MPARADIDSLFEAPEAAQRPYSWADERVHPGKRKLKVSIILDGVEVSSVEGSNIIPDTDVVFGLVTEIARSAGKILAPYARVS